MNYGLQYLIFCLKFCVEGCFRFIKNELNFWICMRSLLLETTVYVTCEEDKGKMLEVNQN